MRVLHLCKYDFRSHNGGIESVCKSMYEYFKANSSRLPGQFHFFLFFSSNNISSEQREGSFHFYTAAINKQLGSTPLSTQYIKKYKEFCDEVDIIHVHVPNPVALLAVYLKVPKAKVIVHWHSDIVKQKMVYPFFRVIEQKVLKTVSAIIATSQNYVEGSRPLAPFRDKVVIIPIGIDALPFKSKENDGISILSIGRMVYYKGFEYLIKAAKHLPDNYRITIVGSGVFHKKLKDLITILGVSNKVTLAGNVSNEELNTLLNNCTVFCLPSVERSEAFGVVLLEALSLGKPIVATNIPYSGVNWVNENGVTGMNVTPKDEQQLAGAIKEILSDEQQYEQFSRNALHRFQLLFTADRMNQSIENLYRTVTGVLEVFEPHNV